tara:strand:- start:501 stop:692 length:192 start_codon:yes stop_codon:yes gene_type:complete
MAETVTNKAKNTATLTNKTRSSATLKWEDADFTWAEGAGTWNNPYSLGNAAKNTATPTNQAKS